MQKTEKIVQKNKYCLISSAIVIVALCIIYALNGIAPFGNNVAMASDSFHQYVPLLSQMFDKIKNGESLVYALSTGIGTSEIGNIINYMFSPLTWIIMLFGRNNLEIGFGISVIVKAALSAFTFSYFLRKKTERNEFSHVIFATLYALSYYFLAYYWNVMWMDAIYMLPLIAYGIHLLIKENKFIPYVLALSYAIITNYYMGFMLCIASVIYYLYEYFTTRTIKDTVEESKNPFKKYVFLKTGLLFAISSIIAAGIAGFAILPMYDVLASTSAVANAKPTGLDFYSPISVLTTHFFGNTTSFYTNNANIGIVPNIYCGILSLLLVVLSFIDKTVSKKEKIINGAVIAFFFLSFCTNILNYLWHAGHYPNSLPYRFSYIYIFFLVYFAYKGYLSLKNLTNKNIAIATVACVVATIVCCMISGPNMTALTLPVTVLLFIAYAIVIALTKNKKKELMTAILLVGILVEIIVPYSTSMKTFESDSLYTHKNDVAQMNETIKENGDIFYRTDLLNHTTNMPGALYGYKGLSTFTSVSYENVSKLQMQLGVNCNGLNSVYYQPQGPIYNMMMSVNYLVNNDSPFELNKDEFELIKEFDTGSKMYQNKYHTSIAISSKTDLSETFNMSGTSPFDVQNKLASSVIDKEIFPMVPVKDVEVKATGLNITVEETKQGFIVKYNKTEAGNSGEIIITTTAPNDGYYYLTAQNALKFEQTTKHNGKELKKNQDIYPGSIGVGNVKTGETIETVIKTTSKTADSGEIYFYISYANMDVVNQFYNTIKENGIANVLIYEEDYIKFDIDSKTNYIFTSIPYDKNWEVKVDGEVVENIKKTADALCLLEVEPGSHTIEFTYRQNSITTGFVITGISIVLFAMMIIISKKKHNKSES